MPVRSPIYLDKLYETKTKVVQKCALYLKVYPVGTFWEKRDDIFIFLDKLVELYPFARKLIGPGIEAFQILQVGDGKISLCIVSLDGSIKPFCHIKAVRGRLLKSTEVYRSFQDIVAKDLRRAADQKFKEQSRKGRDHFFGHDCGGFLKKDVFVDYSGRNFESIIRSFLRLYKIDLKKVRLRGSRESNLRRQLASSELIFEFLSYHQSFASFKLRPKNRKIIFIAKKSA